MDPTVARGKKAKSGDQWKIWGLNSRFEWCPARIGPRTGSLHYVH